MTILNGAIGTLIAIAPGFVLMSIYRRQRHEPDPTDARFAAGSLVASIFPNLTLLPWSLRIRELITTQQIGAGEFAAWALTLVVLVPFALGLAASAFVESSRTQPMLTLVGWGRPARTRTSWAWAFDRAEPAWLIVSLRDGSVAGGRWDAGSFASLDFDRRDLFIRRPFLVNKDRTFGDALPAGRGLWINGSDIMSIEFYPLEVE